MENKKTVRIYIVVALIFVLIYLCFVGFYIILINKIVYLGLVCSDGQSDHVARSINRDIADPMVMSIETEESSIEAPLLSFGKEETVEEEKTVEANGTIMGISAYNLVESQCDSSPTIGAFGDNLEELMNSGTQVCASNTFPRGTVLYIQGFGECVVYDRMNIKYRNHVDICMGKDIEQALNFGRRRLKVSVIN